MVPADGQQKELLRLCRRLMQRAIEIARGRDPSAPWPVEARKASCHAGLALACLESREVQDLLETPASVRGMASDVASQILRQACDAGREAGRLSNPVAAGGLAGIHGSTRTISLPELLSFLQSQEKTGVLRVSAPAEVLTIGFHRGDLVFACSDNSPPGLRLGEILVAQGALEREQLDLLVQKARDGALRLGDLLSREEVVSREDLQRALEHQVQQVFHRLFLGKDAWFSFKEEPPEEAGEGLRLNVMQLLLESARAHDESAGHGVKGDL